MEGHGEIAPTRATSEERAESWPVEQPDSGKPRVRFGLVQADEFTAEEDEDSKLEECRSGDRRHEGARRCRLGLCKKRSTGEEEFGDFDGGEGGAEAELIAGDEEVVAAMGLIVLRGRRVLPPPC